MFWGCRGEVESDDREGCFRSKQVLLEKAGEFDTHIVFGCL